MGLNTSVWRPLALRRPIYVVVEAIAILLGLRRTFNYLRVKRVKTCIYCATCNIECWQIKEGLNERELALVVWVKQWKSCRCCEVKQFSRELDCFHNTLIKV